MKHVLIATHGKMASGIRYTAEMIAGEQTDVTTMDAYVDAEIDLEKELDHYFMERKGERIIVLTDLMGGSVNQKLMQYAAKDEKITLITGINLPMLIQIFLQTKISVKKNCRSLLKKPDKNCRLLAELKKQMRNRQKKKKNRKKLRIRKTKLIRKLP